MSYLDAAKGTAAALGDRAAREHTTTQCRTNYAVGVQLGNGAQGRGWDGWGSWCAGDSIGVFDAVSGVDKEDVVAERLSS